MFECHVSKQYRQGESPGSNYINSNGFARKQLLNSNRGHCLVTLRLILQLGARF